HQLTVISVSDRSLRLEVAGKLRKVDAIAQFAAFRVAMIDEVIEPGRMPGANGISNVRVGVKIPFKVKEGRSVARLILAVQQKMLKHRLEQASRNCRRHV